MLDPVSIIFATLISLIISSVVIMTSMITQSKVEGRRYLIGVILFVLAIIVMVFEQRFNMDGNPVHILSFFGFGLFTMSLLIITCIFRSLYGGNPISNKTKYIVPFITATIFFLISAFELPYISKVLSFSTVIVLILIIFLFDTIVVQKKGSYTLKAQIVLVILIAISRVVSLWIVNPAMTYQNLVDSDVIFTVVLLLLLHSMFYTYLFEILKQQQNKLEILNLRLNHSFEEVKRVSEMDGLTSLINRMKMNELLLEAQERVSSHQQKYVLLLCDANDFKLINDKRGHNEGDKVLVFIATSLKIVLRKSDLISRWGGDEFMILLSDFDKRNTTSLISKINYHLKTESIKKFGYEISLSIGSAQLSNNRPLLQTIDIADKNMYAEKDIYKVSKINN